MSPAYIYPYCFGDFWSSLFDLFEIHIFIKFHLCKATLSFIDVNQLRMSACILNNSCCAKGNKYIRLIYNCCTGIPFNKIDPFCRVV